MQHISEKNYLSLVLALSLALLVSGCGGNGPTSLDSVNPELSSSKVADSAPLPTSMARPQNLDPSAALEPTSEAAATRAPSAARAALLPKPLSAVKTWAIQLDNIEGSGSVTALADSAYDILVLEPVSTLKGSTFDTKSMVSTIKASAASGGTNRKLVLAYIDIGQAESWRAYWTWSTGYTGSGPLPADWPSFIAGPGASGSAEAFPVAFWEPQWQDIIIYGQRSLVNEALNDGFDGVFLDCVDFYKDPSVIELAKTAGRDTAQEMASFIEKIRLHGQAKTPGFLIMQNNAADLAQKCPASMQNIDLISQEAVWYTGASTSRWNDSSGYDRAVPAGTSQSLITLLKPYRNAGKVVCDLEYAKKYAGKAYRNGSAQGYLTYCSRTSLSRLTTTPPPAYNSPAPTPSPTVSPSPSPSPTPVPTASPSPSPAPSPSPVPSPATGLSPIPLSQVKSWAIQLQNTDTSQAAATLGSSRYHMLILEGNNTIKGSSFNTRAMTDQLKATYAGSGPWRKLLIAYTSIGEAEDYRSYWTWASTWPSFIITANSQWVGNYPVAFWDPAWKNIVIYNNDSLVNQAINGGFDGIFLDVVDVFLLPEVADRAALEGKNPALEMANLLQEIRAYAQSRKPGFLIIQNNALELGIMRPESISSIDAIHQESIWYEGTKPGWNVSGSADRVVNSAWTADYLQNLPVYMSAGKPVFDLEYAKTYAGTAYASSLARGFIPYCSQTALSQLTTTPPPNY
ncbi:MAG: endo alpha-1,4 polygalactosaminidase [Candidatus Eremiobacteraeota bacterium]|nr:endo alpha-1,4 polygalactosaminidase [Candidatus Eremiobacteraeota bacterium]